MTWPETRPVEIGDLAYDTRRVTAGALFFCVRGDRVDGHDLAWEAVERGAVGARRGARARRPDPAARRARQPGSHGRRGRHVLRRADEGARGRRCDGDERKDHDGLPPALDARGRGQAGRPRRHGRVEGRGRATGSAVHDARGDRPPAALPRDARRGRPLRRARGLVARRAASPTRSRPLRRARVHEPEPGPPRSARDDGGVLPREALSLHGRSAAPGDRQRGRRVGSQARGVSGRDASCSPA